MKFTANFYARMLGGIAMMYGGFALGQSLSGAPPTAGERWATSLLTLCGLAIGLILSPYLTVAPMQRLIGMLRATPFSEILAVGFGIVAGLLAAVLVTVPLSYLPGALGQYSPVVAAALLAYIGGSIANARKQEIAGLMGRLTQGGAESGKGRTVVDTSIIVDGRIAQVVESGFLAGTLLVPRFVLLELQHLADSPHELTRAKGKRGLDILRTLQESKQVEVVITPGEVRFDQEVDAKLVAVALKESAPLLTNDANLGRVAELQGVRALNFNRLAEALRLPFTVGDRVSVTVRSEGREREQGVGFSADGTMIVVEDARRLIGQEVPAVVTRVYTTQSGRIIFAQLERAS